MRLVTAQRNENWQLGGGGRDPETRVMETVFTRIAVLELPSLFLQFLWDKIQDARGHP